MQRCATAATNDERGKNPTAKEPKTELTYIHGRRPGDVYIRRPSLRIRGLRRVLGVSALFSTGYGNVGSSIYYALGVTALYALGAAPLALAVAGVFFIFTVLTYTEATVTMPEAGGASSFARHGFNEMVSFLAGWATMLSYTVTISISAFTAGGYLSVFIPILGEYPYNAIFAIGAIIVLMLLNIVGVQEAATLSVVFAVIDLLTQILLVIIGSIFILNLPLLLNQINFGVAPTWGNFLFGISVAMVAYTGIETISNMAEEARVPENSVPRAYGLLIFAVLVLFIGISAIGLSAMPVTQVNGQHTTELATTYIEDPVAGIAHSMPSPLDSIFLPLVGILASTILLIGANAGIIGVSRLSFSMGAYQQIPSFIYAIHSRFRTPYVAIAFFCIVAALLVIPGQITELADAYIFGAMLTFTLAHAAVIGMRIREPERPRPFKPPLNLRIRGAEIPLTAVIGGLGTFAVWIIVAATHPFGRTVGILWIIFGVGLYVYYRRKIGLPLTKTVKRQIARRVVRTSAPDQTASQQ